MYLRTAEIERVVQIALDEDLPWGDLTTDNLIDQTWHASGSIIAKASGVLAGLPVMSTTFRLVDPAIQIELLCQDGDAIQPGDVVAHLEGAAASILRGERVALNFLQRLSGVATLTSRFVAAVGELPTRIVDTRKTTPGLRRLQKYAVRMGGGSNHRFALSDGVMLKDNHLAILRHQGISLTEALATMRRRIPHGIKIEVEVETFAELQTALDAGADIILLDNMSPAQLRQAVTLINGRALTEASGGITLESVRAVAESGVDLISSGALTHSAPALDLSLEMSYTS